MKTLATDGSCFSSGTEFPLRCLPSSVAVPRAESGASWCAAGFRRCPPCQLHCVPRLPPVIERSLSHAAGSEEIRALTTDLRMASGRPLRRDNCDARTGSRSLARRAPPSSMMPSSSCSPLAIVGQTASAPAALLVTRLCVPGTDAIPRR